MKKTIFFGLLVFAAVRISGQPKTNLQIMLSMLDSSATEISSMVTVGKAELIISSPGNLELLKQNLRASFGKNLKITEFGTDGASVIYNINQAEVSYPEVFRDGLFGQYLASREIKLSGSFSVAEHGEQLFADDIDLFRRDTLTFDKLGFVENSSLPFTKGDIPPEPFWPGILEPVIAVGAVAVTLLLFFTVRSK